MSVIIARLWTGFGPEMIAAFFKNVVLQFEVGIFASQAAQLVRCGLLAYGSKPFAPELRRLRALAGPIRKARPH